MIFGIDLHDTISYRPDMFNPLLATLYASGHTILIISGTPESDRQHAIDLLSRLGVIYHKLVLGFDYEKEGMTHNHFLKMRKWKLQCCIENEVDIYIDDNPYYVKYLADHGILVLQTILSSVYIERFRREDPYFTCNLQEKQFDFLNTEVLERK